MSLDLHTLDLEQDGIYASRVYWNLTTSALYEEAVRRQEGLIAADGPLACRTGQHTGRSPNDKFIVREPSSEKDIAWGGPNRPIRVITEYAWHSLFARNLFIVDPAATGEHVAALTIIDAPSFRADPARHGT